jgi:aminopeptidase
MANLPTEEVFTMPHCYKVNGIVYNSLPLNNNGNIIDKFYIKFKNGKAYEYHAKVGNE